jgi:hypothetical protein
LHEFCRPKPKLRKCTKHDFWVKRGGLCAFILKISTASFFAPQVARTTLVGEFGTSFVDRNRNFENAPNMSFGSNGVDWVRSFRKNQLQVFCSTSGQNGTRGRVLHEFCRPKPKLQKRTKNEFWVKQSGLGAFVSKNSTLSFFDSTVARTALGGGFYTSFEDRNRKSKNAPNISFRSNGVDCERSFRKTQCLGFSLQPWPELPFGAGFARVLSTETETSKTHQT